MPKGHGWAARAAHVLRHTGESPRAPRSRARGRRASLCGARRVCGARMSVVHVCPRSLNVSAEPPRAAAGRQGGRCLGAAARARAHGARHQVGGASADPSLAPPPLFVPTFDFCAPQSVSPGVPKSTGTGRKPLLPLKPTAPPHRPPLWGCHGPRSRGRRRPAAYVPAAHSPRGWARPAAGARPFPRQACPHSKLSTVLRSGRREAGCGSPNLISKHAPVTRSRCGTLPPAFSRGPASQGPDPDGLHPSGPSRPVSLCPVPPRRDRNPTLSG